MSARKRTVRRTKQPRAKRRALRAGRCEGCGYPVHPSDGDEARSRAIAQEGRAQAEPSVSEAPIIKQYRGFVFRNPATKIWWFQSQQRIFTSTYCLLQLQKRGSDDAPEIVEVEVTVREVDSCSTSALRRAPRNPNATTLAELVPAKARVEPPPPPPPKPKPQPQKCTECGEVEPKHLPYCGRAPDSRFSRLEVD